MSRIELGEFKLRNERQPNVIRQVDTATQVRVRKSCPRYGGYHGRKFRGGSDARDQTLGGAREVWGSAHQHLQVHHIGIHTVVVIHKIQLHDVFPRFGECVARERAAAAGPIIELPCVGDHIETRCCEGSGTIERYLFTNTHHCRDRLAHYGHCGGSFARGITGYGGSEIPHTASVGNELHCQTTTRVERGGRNDQGLEVRTGIIS